VTVPNVVGRTESAATAALQDVGFKVKVQHVLVTDSAEDGIVQDQTPNSGQQADKGSSVTIIVGKKP
jgi:serine/threonine-protein kinase